MLSSVLRLLSSPRLPYVAAGWLLVSLGASAQNTRIYTCIDAHGQRQTSDRPIMACLDREQRELSSTGIVLRVIPPSLSAAEREANAARQRAADQERQRQLETLRRDRALFTRYPDQASHEDSRKQALAQVQTNIAAIERHIAQLTSERTELDNELEFYRKDPAKTPAKLLRSIEDNTQAVQEQRRVLTSQQEECQRIVARFDEEASRLQPMWAARAAATPSAQQR